MGMPYPCIDWNMQFVQEMEESQEIEENPDLQDIDARLDEINQGMEAEQIQARTTPNQQPKQLIDNFIKRNKHVFVVLF